MKASGQLPEIVPAYESVGRVSKALSRELGLRKEPPVLIGGNDAVLAAFSLGIDEPGDIINVNGTCEITLVCLDKCLASANYNIRAHVLPDRWLTLHERRGQSPRLVPAVVLQRIGNRAVLRRVPAAGD
ncbi:MAG: hypothetical protein ACYSWQ_29255 [Planctomycetota bacterium]